MYEPRHLGKHSSEPVEKLDLIPWTEGEIAVELDCSEFTSRCPVTGQPDFGELKIEYIPRDFLAETKSVKLYLMKFREERGFNEQLVCMIADDWASQLKPKWLRVQGTFNRRGGIAVTATAERSTR